MEYLDPTFLAIQTLNGLQLAMLLFLLAVGLSVVFGLMDFINLAHATLYLLGAYFGVAAVGLVESFWFALLVAPIGVAIVGSIFYLLLLRHMQGRDYMKQVLVTFGLIFVGQDAVRMIWGNFAQVIPGPELFTGSVSLLGETYPAYRLFIIGLGVTVMVLLYLGLERTRLGAIVRAGVDNRTMASSLGINVDRAFFMVFCLGCYLAGLAGVVAAPVLSVYPGMDMSVLILALVVVVVGGPGSLRGAVVGSLLIAMAETFGQVFVPQFASATIYAVMALILVFRPQGLVPVRGAQ